MIRNFVSERRVVLDEINSGFNRLAEGHATRPIIKF